MCNTMKKMVKCRLFSLLLALYLVPMRQRGKGHLLEHGHSFGGIQYLGLLVALYVMTSGALVLNVRSSEKKSIQMGK